MKSVSSPLHSEGELEPPEISRARRAGSRGSGPAEKNQFACILADWLLFWRELRFPEALRLGAA